MSKLERRVKKSPKSFFLEELSEINSLLNFSITACVNLGIIFRSQRTQN